MFRRRRSPYRLSLGWTLGVAFEGTLARLKRPAQEFTYIRCCGSPRASSPHGLTAPAPASHDGEYCVQLPPARGCYHLAPRRTFTSNPVPMPGTPPRGSMRAARKLARASTPFFLSQTGTLSRRHPAHFVSAIDMSEKHREGGEAKISHRNIASKPLPGVRKRRTNSAQIRQKGRQKPHPHPESLFR